jgi:tRNA (mo5U34)-methyltransferase
VRGLWHRVRPSSPAILAGPHGNELHAAGAPASARNIIPGVDALPDEELQRLNSLLPWAAYVLDARGRRFGQAYSPTKRNAPQTFPDRRIVELDRRAPLSERTVLEIGCFEGIHTAALAMRARHVKACDGRIENVVKTIVRCAMFGVAPSVFRWDMEEPPPAGIDLASDVLHHVGVLYHLTDPVGHLAGLLPHVKDAVLLDTQVAAPEAARETYEAGGRRVRYAHFSEAGREPPFAGLRGHAKWLVADDLVALVRELGFAHTDVTRLKQERNGWRLTLYARR